jgi:hypothetical protein
MASTTAELPGPGLLYILFQRSNTEEYRQAVRNLKSQATQMSWLMAEARDRGKLLADEHSRIVTVFVREANGFDGQYMLE